MGSIQEALINSGRIKTTDVDRIQRQTTIEAERKRKDKDQSRWRAAMCSLPEELGSAIREINAAKPGAVSLISAEGWANTVKSIELQGDKVDPQFGLEYLRRAGLLKDDN